jgi:hypothetical protein
VRFRAFAIVVAGCSAAAAPAPAVRNASAPVAASRASEDTCALVAAMLAVDDKSFQELYANKKCGLDIPLHDPLVVHLEAPAALMSSGTTCPGRRFQLFQGDPDLQGAIIELVVFPHGAAWGFMATVDQPNLAPDPEGGFDVIESYCHDIDGVVERSVRGWRAYVQH